MFLTGTYSQESHINFVKTLNSFYKFHQSLRHIYYMSPAHMNVNYDDLFQAEPWIVAWDVYMAGFVTSQLLKSFIVQ